jgi:hypothetical protein
MADTTAEMSAAREMFADVQPTEGRSAGVFQ